MGAQRNFLLVGIGLSAPLGAQRNFLSIGIVLSASFTLSERPKVVVFQNTNGQTVETCLKKLQTKFEDDPTINKFGIAILLD